MPKANLPLNLEGAHNIRELGGYPVRSGGYTKTGAFLRSDGTHQLTAADLQQLKDFGITLVVDMRSLDEIERCPSRLNGIDGIRYENVIMFDSIQSSFFSILPDSMSALYIQLLDECQPQYNKIFTLFAQNNGASLFNCTAGKDRTGVVAMLLLQLANVGDEYIIADYAASQKNMEGVFFLQRNKLEHDHIEVPQFVFESAPEEMQLALKHLYSKYGNAASYLEHCGMTKDLIKLLRKKLVLE